VGEFFAAHLRVDIVFADNIIIDTEGNYMSASVCPDRIYQSAVTGKATRSLTQRQ
jgi:hypothetical protein